MELINHYKVREYFPDAYKGEIENVSILEWATRFEFPPIMFRVKNWIITTEGINYIPKSYEIETARLDENWERHMMEKIWVNDDFLTILHHARRMRNLGLIK